MFACNRIIISKDDAWAGCRSSLNSAAWVRLASRLPHAFIASVPSARRFPPPWTIDEANDACFIVRDNTGRRSAISISRMSPAGDQRPSCSPGTRRQMAATFAKPPELLLQRPRH